uniref:Uncharacterized protein n=1 Tax=Kalanchoe fedtschenkoi TaxID=63787 RepID=A0A7N0SZF3_KALFE
MSFGGFIDSTASATDGSGPARFVSDLHFNSSSSDSPSKGMMLSNGVFSPQQRLVGQTFSKSIFSSPALSLALQTGLEAQGEVVRIGESYDGGGGGGVSGGVGGRRSREEEHESRSGSDNMDGGSADDLDAADINPSKKKKKRYHRHTPQQIQELEALFKECPHPDEKQRLQLSKRLNLETRQVKFWFQNRRTQMKTQIERHENSMLRSENDKLRAENMSLREAMRNPMCVHCGGPAIIGESSLEEQHLRLENARLRDELERVCGLASKFLGQPVSALGNGHMLQMCSNLELGVGNNNCNGGLSTSLPFGPDFGADMFSSSGAVAVNRSAINNYNATGMDKTPERSVLLEVALAAMDELIKLAQTDEPLWIKGSEGGREILNREEYKRTFTPCMGMKPNGYVTEASRETGVVIINSLALVETLMDSNRWAEMFPGMIARAATIEVISNGMGGTRNGSLQLMHTELQVLSPLVPVREVTFLRFCKQHAEGVWAVVDVSIESVRNSSGAPAYVKCRRLPSGCLVEDMPNGYSKVTWVEHAEYDESEVHQLYRPLLSSGLGFGAQRWVATLQRQSQCLAILMSSAVPSGDNSAITASGRKSMVKLAQRLTNNFCAGVCASTVHKWNKLSSGNVGDDIRVMTRKSVNDPGEPPGIVLSAATSVWLPVPPQRIFDFLRNESLRSEWDILSNGGPMQEMARIAKGQDHGNCVSLLRAGAMNPNQSSMLILQETCTDAAGSLVVYAPVDIPAMHVVMNGGDSAYVALLPSGFSIVPDGSSSTVRPRGSNPDGPVEGSLLTVAFQILVSSLPTAKLTVESVDTVSNLISCTVQKIKAALNCEN